MGGVSEVRVGRSWGPLHRYGTARTRDSCCRVCWLLTGVEGVGTGACSAADSKQKPLAGVACRHAQTPGCSPLLAHLEHTKHANHHRGRAIHQDAHSCEAGRT